MSPRGSRAEKVRNVKEALELCERSTLAFASVFLPHHCYRPFCALHQRIFDLIDDDEKRAVAIAAPRGWGKTTLGALAYPLRRIIYGQSRYILLISATWKKAVKDLRTLAEELRTNELISGVCGSLKGQQWAEGTGEIELVSGVKVEALGSGQQIRGLKYRNYRPDLIVLDDIEDPDQVQNEDLRARLKEWLFADVMNSINLESTKIVMLGTILHEDSLLQNILEEAEWDRDDPLSENQWATMERFHTLRIELCDDNYVSNWPDFMSTEQVRAKAEAYRRRGLLDVFFREFRNIPIAREGAVFPSEFKYYDPKKEWPAERVVIVDPAKTTNISSDYSAIVVGGFDAETNRIYFMDCVNARLHPEEIYRAAWEMAVRLKTLNIGIEVTSLNEFVTYPFNSFLASKGFPPAIPLKAKGKKEDRIKALAPFYRMGAILHHPAKHIHGPLESQLLSFPRSKHDDVADAFAYILEMLHIGDRFFSAIEDGVGAEDLFEEVSSPLPEDWRVAP